MNISENGKSDDNQYEWTMTRYGRYSNGDYDAWRVLPHGFVGGVYLGSSISIRPVFYLKSSTDIMKGKGSSTEPYIIKK